jgi:hypothetical protein
MDSAWTFTATIFFLTVSSSLIKCEYEYALVLFPNHIENSPITPTHPKNIDPAMTNPFGKCGGSRS